MLIRQGQERTLAADRRLAATLAAIAGALNTAAFQAFGFFSANMTGNASLLSSHLAAAAWRYAAMFFSIVVAFIAGAATSTVLINAGRRRKSRGVYALSIFLEALLLAVLGCVELWGPVMRRDITLIVALSFLMGLQNAVVTRISDARVRTTHISGMVTDIGIELGILFDLFRKAERRADFPNVISSLRLHGETVLAFCVGGVAGVLIYRSIGNLILFVAASVLLLIALWGLLRARKSPPQSQV